MIGGLERGVHTSKRFVDCHLGCWTFPTGILLDGTKHVDGRIDSSRTQDPSREKRKNFELFLSRGSTEKIGQLEAEGFVYWKNIRFIP